MEWGTRALLGLRSRYWDALGLAHEVAESFGFRAQAGWRGSTFRGIFDQYREPKRSITNQSERKAVTDKNERSEPAPVKFKRPPVVEVVCGVLFTVPQPLKSSHVGAFWEQVRKEFPRVEDAAPLAAVVEEPGRTTPEYQFTNMPPLRRSWLISGGGEHLIQLQEDRFLFNWKRASDDTSYPSFLVVREHFEKHLAGFVAFCEKIGIGKPSYRQFELSYVNQISSANGLDAVTLDRLLIDHVRDHSRERFLPSPEAINWVTAYQLPDGQGRLHVAAQSATDLSVNARLVRLDLTARGITSDHTDAGRKTWFDLAHEWITRGFADITASELQTDQYWQRTS